ncbi:hypothetical protein RUND412_006775 [Rhizina undulata]
MSSSPPLIQPIPRRPFQLPEDNDAPTNPSGISSPPPLDSSKRSKSTISLTTSTLFGIYSHSYDDPGSPQTPNMSRNPSTINIAEAFAPKQSTPAPLQNRSSMLNAEERKHKIPKPKPPFGSRILKIAALFVLGVAYGAIVICLHDSSLSWVAVKVERYILHYLCLWGLAGVALGSLLPWLDGDEVDGGMVAGGKWDWNPVVRSFGAFVGIAFAIRKLPWQSTLQVSLTLALVNPFLWYILDRTRSGFLFSTLVGIFGTAFLLQTNPEMIQAPEVIGNASSSVGAAEAPMVAGLISTDMVGTGTWIASVLFCSCVCFGNIGRRFAWKGREI